MFRSSFIATALAVVLLAPAAAQAEVVVAGTGEPAFTNSANNTQWVRWTTRGNYRIEFNHQVNGGAIVKQGPFQVAQTGTSWVNWSGVANVPLTEGNTYTICGFGRWDDGTGMYFPDFSTSCGDADRRGLRASTTIDRTAPVIGVTLAGGTGVTKSASIPLRIGFSDDIAGPFPANFVCVEYSAAGPLCDAGRGFKYVEQPNCSQPRNGGRNTNFDCNIEVGGGSTPAPDGPVSVCVMAADASIPDNPNSSDQRATSAQANRSAPTCATTVLDRVAPTAALKGPDQLAVGEGAIFSATVGDTTSGVNTSTATISWGDSTGSAKGLEASHSFAGPGTYKLTFTVTDNAGNATEVSKTVKVMAASPNPNPNPNPTPTPTPSPTPTVPSTPGSGAGTQTGGATASSTSGTTSTGSSTSASTGGKDQAGATRLTVTSLGISKRVLRLRVNGATGSARVILWRGSRVVATTRAKVNGGLVRVTLPKKLKGGSYVAEVTIGDRVGKVPVKVSGARIRAMVARAGIVEIDERGLERVLP